MNTIINSIANVNKSLLIITVGFILCGHSSIAAAVVSPKDIIAKSDAKRGLQESFSMVANIEFIDGKDVQKSTYQIKAKDSVTSLVDQTAPERNRGRRLLMKGYDMWLFTPNIKRPVRVGMEQRLTGDVSNGDIARTNLKDDYEPKMEGEEFVGKEDCYKMLLTANNKNVTYSKIHIWISKKDFAPQKSIYYALSGKPLKTATFEDYKMIDGLTRSTKMVIRDYLKKDRISVIVYSKHKKENFNDSLFNKDQMDF